MCLAVPVKIEEINGNIAIASTGGVKRKIGIDLTPDVKIGEYVLLHAGFAIGKISEKDAKETLELLKEIFKQAEKENFR